MLQRSLQRFPARQWPPKPIFHSGHVCACKCGRQLTSIVSERKYATTRPAPSTPDRTPRRRALSPEEARRTKQNETKRHDAFYHSLQRLYSAKITTVLPDVAVGFLNDFHQLASQAKGLPTADPVKFMSLVEEHSIPFSDCRALAKTLMAWGVNNADSRISGKKLWLTLSRVGDEESTISVMGHAYLQEQKRPGTLKSKEIRYSRDLLTQIAEQGHNFRAQVLEGRIAQQGGNEEKAIRLWTAAMASAVEAAEEEESARKAGVRIKDNYYDRFELNSPWIDLFKIHWDRTEFKGKSEASQSQWALEIGCQQDDPDAHYLYAKKFIAPEKGDCSEWLYYIMKAATSGHRQAAFDLGEFYAESTWKYIDDEPPDDVKPTPFDSYPAPTLISLWTRVRAFLGIKPIQRDQRESIWHAAIFPSTAEERVKMAKEWIVIALRYTYAPAALFAAKMHMRKTLNSFGTAPQAALKLQDSRYTYASKAEYEAGKAEEALRRDYPERYADVETEDHRVNQEDGPPNPMYNLDAAQSCLREVFYAAEACKEVEDRKKAYAKARRLGRVHAVDDEDDLVSEESFARSPWHIRKWLRNVEVRESYEDQIGDMLNEAKAFCDDYGWDLYHDDGGLIYRAKRATGKKQAIAA